MSTCYCYEFLFHKFQFYIENKREFENYERQYCNNNVIQTMTSQIMPSERAWLNQDQDFRTVSLLSTLSRDGLGMGLNF